MTSVTSASIISYDLRRDRGGHDAALTNTVTLQPRNRRPGSRSPRVQFPLAVIPPFLLYRPVLPSRRLLGLPAGSGEIKQACMDTVAYWIERDVEHYTQDLGSDDRDGRHGDHRPRPVPDQDPSSAARGAFAGRSVPANSARLMATKSPGQDRVTVSGSEEGCPRDGAVCARARS
jgi:hypothetical protein